MSDDYRYAKVFVSIMGGAKEKKRVLGGLRHAQGFIQKALSRRIQMRVFPEIHFELDESLEKSFEVLNTLNKLAKERKAREAGADGGAPGEEE